MASIRRRPESSTTREACLAWPQHGILPRRHFLAIHSLAFSLSSKLPDVGTTIFTVMSQLAREQGAINLSQGYPDFDCPVELLERVVYYLRSGHNQYAPMAGVPELREVVSDKIEECYGLEVDPVHQITITPGATEALYVAVSSVIGPGDEAIVLDPAYDTYDPAVRLNGGIPVHVPLRPSDFKVDWQAVSESITDRTRLIITNTPHNPTGAVWDASDIAQLAELVNRHGIFVVADEVYEHIVFDGQRHESLTRYPEIFERSFVVSSFGKTLHATGWRIGVCVAPAPLAVEFRKIHQFVNFSTNAPLQYGIADFLREHPQHYRELSGFYQAKRDLFAQLLAPSRFTLQPSQGTYFQLLDYSNISHELDEDLSVRLTHEIKVASVPVSVFCKEPLNSRVLRFCFAKHEDTLREAAERLCAL